jgi:NTP pyrophosphatase (non-canonical NTP hydrolase)
MTAAESDPMHVFFQQVIDTVKKAQAKHPRWPYDPLHAMAILQEEVGELQQAVLERMYEPLKAEEGAVDKETLHVAAMIVRFALSRWRYDWHPKSDQHAQEIT